MRDSREREVTVSDTSSDENAAHEESVEAGKELQDESIRRISNHTSAPEPELHERIAALEEQVRAEIDARNAEKISAGAVDLVLHGIELIIGCILLAAGVAAIAVGGTGVASAAISIGGALLGTLTFFEIVRMTILKVGKYL